MTSDVSKLLYRILRKSAYLDSHPDIWIDGNPDIRTPGNSDVRQSGYPDFRKSAYPDFRKSGPPEFWTSGCPCFQVLGNESRKSKNPVSRKSGNPVRIISLKTHIGCKICACGLFLGNMATRRCISDGKTELKHERSWSQEPQMKWTTILEMVLFMACGVSRFHFGNASDVHLESDSNPTLSTMHLSTPTSLRSLCESCTDATDPDMVQTLNLYTRPIDPSQCDSVTEVADV